MGDHSSDQENPASDSDLKAMLATALEECKAAKTSAAHHRLQYELLNLDTSEALKRKDVELDMARREVDVLQRSDIIIPTSSRPLSTYDQAFADLRNKCRSLEVYNARLYGRLEHATALVMDSESSRSYQAATFRKRIRDNRKHMSELRQRGSLFGELLPNAEGGRVHNRDDEYNTATPKAQRDERITDLLLADQYLSQEATSSPSTPHGSRQRGHRPAQSLTSLPSTPHRSAPLANGPYYLKAPLQSPIRSATRATRRRESRDSTISASDVDNDEVDERIMDSEDGWGSEDETQVQASQASQEAANMLRKSSSVGRSNAHKSGPKAPAAHSRSSQSMMYGYQLKPGAAGQAESIKRRFYDDGTGGEEERSRKRGRSSMSLGGNDGVGLGIGGWVR